MAIHVQLFVTTGHSPPSLYLAHDGLCIPLLVFAHLRTIPVMGSGLAALAQVGSRFTVGNKQRDSRCTPAKQERPEGEGRPVGRCGCFCFLVASSQVGHRGLFRQELEE